MSKSGKKFTEVLVKKEKTGTPVPKPTKQAQLPGKKEPLVKEQKEHKEPVTKKDWSQFEIPEGCCINPVTNRLIKINGTTHRRLIQDNLMGEDPSSYKQPAKVIYQAETREDAQDMVQKIKSGKVKDIVPKNKNVKILPDNKVILARRRMSVKDVSDRMKQVIMDVYLENSDGR